MKGVHAPFLSKMVYERLIKGLDLGAIPRV